MCVLCKQPAGAVHFGRAPSRMPRSGGCRSHECLGMSQTRRVVCALAPAGVVVIVGGSSGCERQTGEECAVAGGMPGYDMNDTACEETPAVRGLQRYRQHVHRSSSSAAAVEEDSAQDEGHLEGVRRSV